MPLFIPTAPSISVSMMAEVPMTILFWISPCPDSLQRPVSYISDTPRWIDLTRLYRKGRRSWLRPLCFHDGIDCYGVILYELIANRKDVKFLYPCGSSADTVIQQHIKFQASFLTDLDQIGHIKGLKKVTIGLGAFVQSAYAAALVVSLGSTSFGILTSAYSAFRIGWRTTVFNRLTSHFLGSLR